jgi:RNA polymerase sigma-70 factor, ECF subfamily
MSGRRVSESSHHIVEQTFRGAYGRIVAALVRRFGVNELPRIENAVQDAGVRALEQWQDGTIPSDPESWLIRVAHNLLLNALRHDRRNVGMPFEDLRAEDTIRRDLDDELCLIFLCCHPVLSRAAQVALTLRIAYGFTTTQIARAFLSDERTIAQRIVRAKQTLRQTGAHFEIPNSGDLPSRLDAILSVLYQVFTEGYAATEEESGVDEALCQESLRLSRLLTDDPRTSLPAAEGVRALFCFQSSRTAARRADDGSLLLLQEQDRTRWDQDLIAEGFLWLGRSSRGQEVSRFHVEAGIAACHSAAETYAKTDWAQIVSLYEILRSRAPSPVIDVNRALAIAMNCGAQTGLDELDTIPERDLMARYPYALAAYAELHAALGELDLARSYLDRALEHQVSSAERRLLQRKRAGLDRREGS